MKEENIKQQNEQKIMQLINTFLRNTDLCYIDEHNYINSKIIKNLSEAYKNLRESK